MIIDSSQFRLNRPTVLGIVVSPLVLTVAMGLLLTTDATRGFTMRMSRENSVIELVTAGLMIVGGTLGMVLARRAKVCHERWWVCGFFLLFSLGMLIVGMEEIAWGQKLAGFTTPAVFEQFNQQQELTLHNLPGLHGHSEVMWAVFGVGGLVGVFTKKWRSFEKIATPAVLIPWFAMILLVALPSAWNEFGSIERRVDLLIGRLDEFSEMLIAMVSCLYVWLCARRLEDGVTDSGLRGSLQDSTVPHPEGVGLGGD